MRSQEPSGRTVVDVVHGVAKLTVVHDGFEPGSPVLQGISEGWPAVLASLKTPLETGSAYRPRRLRCTSEVPSQLGRSNTLQGSMGACGKPKAIGLGFAG